ncbi:AbrB/MazE/SpoVT family DNA-binding domain-containing protein [Alcanivorax sp.]|uniref:antitoxin n=1 Tax=Alcanivorax sp. TaxID=1872427 RepID=UPI000C0D6FCA|nr:AbrB/MazE/SpoVT family DNA-binding domain-containing protein [Alcanivorax sp.]PHR64197.1 MAG: AbrB/MazE/SpoVT family DNA-binding domain-containing protein [Alcanivorax sp.]
MSDTAKLFMNGRSQAVRLPARYRFDTDEVYIRRDPETGDIILSSKPNGWSEFFAMLDKYSMPSDFLSDHNQGELPDKRGIDGIDNKSY